jgi:hypothetical protein
MDGDRIVIVKQILHYADELNLDGSWWEISLFGVPYRIYSNVLKSCFNPIDNRGW